MFLVKIDIELNYFNVVDSANARNTDRKDLLSELELMKRLKPHPHVIKLLGCVTETGGLVMNCPFCVWMILKVTSTYIYLVHNFCLPGSL